MAEGLRAKYLSSWGKAIWAWANRRQGGGAMEADDGVVAAQGVLSACREREEPGAVWGETRGAGSTWMARWRPRAAALVERGGRGERKQSFWFFCDF